MLPMTAESRETWDKTGIKKRGLSERRVPERSPEGQLLTQELIEAFLAAMDEAGRAESTLDAYRRCLNRLYAYLPAEKVICAGTVDRWQQSMEESGNYTGSSLNLYRSAANMFLDWCGRADLWGTANAFEKESVQPELTRREFYRLLQAAKEADNEQIYLVVKAFGLLGNTVSELSSLTAEAVRRGRVCFPRSGIVAIPSGFQAELQEFAEQNGIYRGPVFLSRNGIPLDRSNIFRCVRNLSLDAQVEEQKCTPRCLAGMCRQTKKGIRQSMELMEEQMYERLLEKEEHAITGR